MAASTSGSESEGTSAMATPVAGLSTAVMAGSPQKECARADCCRREKGARSRSAQEEPRDVVVCPFFQNELGSTSGRSDVLLQIDQVDAGPDVGGDGGDLVVGKISETMEKGIRLLQDRGPQAKQALGEPAGDVT